jgi:hypothetical protein
MRQQLQGCEKNQHFGMPIESMETAHRRSHLLRARGVHDDLVLSVAITL